MDQIVLIISAITPVLATAQFELFLFTVSSFARIRKFSYQLPISGSSISIVIVSATPLSYF